jgi:hypothetical protein
MAAKTETIRIILNRLTKGYQMKSTLAHAASLSRNELRELFANMNCIFAVGFFGKAVERKAVSPMMCQGCPSEPECPKVK